MDSDCGWTHDLGLWGKEFKGKVIGIGRESSDLVGDFLHTIGFSDAGCVNSFGGSSLGASLDCERERNYCCCFVTPQFAPYSVDTEAFSAECIWSTIIPLQPLEYSKSRLFAGTDVPN